ncbi:MAG: OmpA family protein, partial [Methylobacter sp.]|nr:OmpA family protein [Methylobacter sp.]
FTLSALITIKALELPVQPPTTQHTQQALSPELSPIIQKLADDQDAHKAIVTDLQGKIAQLEDKLKTQKQAADSIKPPAPENVPRTVTVISGWNFRPGKIGVNDAALSTLKNVLGELTVDQDSRIIIEGHTDNIPTGKLYIDNMNLSLRRAKAIAEILLAQGIPTERISVIGYGETKPIDDNDTEEGRAKNRRVEVKLVAKQGKPE